MRRGSRGTSSALFVLVALAAVLAAPAALAYHGEDGAAGLVVRGPIAIDGRAELRAQPAAASFEGPGDVEVLLSQGVARVRVVELREHSNAALAAADRARSHEEQPFELPSPRVQFVERGLDFHALLFTSGGLTSFRLDAPLGLRLERADPVSLAPTPAARAAGLDPTAPGGFEHRVAAPGVAALAQRGAVAASGDFSLFLYGATVRFASADAAYEERLGAWTERDALGDVQVVRYAVVELRQAQATLPFSSGFAGFFADVVDLDYDGTASLASARGRAVVGERASGADGGPVLLSGILSGSAWPTRGDDGGVRFEARGDVTALAVGATSASFLREGPAAAASALVLALGALAYFWPALKTGIVAPLYARFNGDEVMDHEWRDRAFDYVKANPGASVNDLAAGLGVAWSTAAYHLRVLEREGFLRGERRGRHRRFFAVGEPPAARDAAFAAEHPTARRILGALATRPGLSQKELAAEAGVVPSTASWHLERLRDAGFVTSAREWRTVRYAPGPRFGELAGRI